MSDRLLEDDALAKRQREFRDNVCTMMTLYDKGYIDHQTATATHSAIIKAIDNGNAALYQETHGYASIEVLPDEIMTHILSYIYEPPDCHMKLYHVNRNENPHGRMVLASVSRRWYRIIHHMCQNVDVSLSVSNLCTVRNLYSNMRWSDKHPLTMGGTKVLRMMPLSQERIIIQFYLNRGPKLIVLAKLLDELSKIPPTVKFTLELTNHYDSVYVQPSVRILTLVNAFMQTRPNFMLYVSLVEYGDPVSVEADALLRQMHTNGIPIYIIHEGAEPIPFTAE